MTEESVLENWIDRLREAVLAEVTSPLAIPAAKGVEWVALSEGWEIPDWVYALANGNANRFEVLSVAGGVWVIKETPKMPDGK